MSKKKSAWLLVIRIVVGLAFIGFGWIKITSMPMIIPYFASFGLPAWFAYAVGYGEFLGGIAVLFGVLTSTVSFLLCLIMIGAVYYTFMPGNYEFLAPLVLFVLCAILLKNGPGKHALCKRKK
jgi:putative oxidoreductase